MTQVDKEASKVVFNSKVPIVLIPSNIACSVPLATYLALREGTSGLFSTMFDYNEDALLNASHKV